MLKNTFLFITLFISLLQADPTYFEIGIGHYNNRSSGANGIEAKPDQINLAIKSFLHAYEQESNKVEIGVYLLRCYYYKGKYVSETDDDKKIIFNKGKELGESLINNHPKSASARYWYLANLGSWSEVYGILAAAKEGVANIMRVQAEKIIELDSKYWNGGGYFMLGGVHLKSPYIPFILSWPNKEKALEYLLKAYETGSTTPVQIVYLAQGYYKNRQKKMAVSLLEDLIKQPLSEQETVESLEQKKIAEGLLEEWR